jgi:hypothetical protein
MPTNARRSFTSTRLLGIFGGFGVRESHIRQKIYFNIVMTLKRHFAESYIILI